MTMVIYFPGEDPDVYTVPATITRRDAESLAEGGLCYEFREGDDAPAQ
jgi:hypothetical protein